MTKVSLPDVYPTKALSLELYYLESDVSEHSEISFRKGSAPHMKERH